MYKYVSHRNFQQHQHNLKYESNKLGKRFNSNNFGGFWRFEFHNNRKLIFGIEMLK